MNIKIWRKDEVELGFSKGDYLISILSTHETPLSDEVKSRYKEVLELRIDDIQKEYDGLTLFSMEHRQQVMKFVHGFYEYMSEETLDVHCSEGVGRSLAVALGIGVWESDIGLVYKIIKENKYISPNEHILKMFIEGDVEWNWILGYFRLRKKASELDKDALEKLVLHLGLDRSFYKYLLDDIERKSYWNYIFEDN